MLRKLVVGPYEANCYILGCKETHQGLVIDPGDEVFRLVQEIKRSGLHIRYILLSHGHMDHTEGAAELRKITGASLMIHPLDAPGLNARPDGFLSDGQRIHVGRYTILVLHTPGHSPGSVSFHAPGAIFTGDTLFAGSVGRTDFQGGDHQQLVEGVRRKLFPLGDKERIYPGHGPSSTIGRERLTNPFFEFSRTA